MLTINLAIRATRCFSLVGHDGELSPAQWMARRSTRAPRRIFESRRLAEDPMTLAELADEFGLSRERVRQIEARAFEKVQEAVKNRLAAIETPVQKPMY